MRRGGGHFDPDRRAVDLANAQQVIDDAFIAIEQLDEGLARLRIDEARRVERLDDALGGVGRIAEDRS